MAKKKKGIITYALIAGAVVAAVLLIRKMNKDKKRGFKSTVFADNSIPQSEEQFMLERESADQVKTPIDTALDVIRQVFPKKTAEQKAARKTKIAERKKTRLATRTTKRTKKANVGFVESVLY